MFPMQLNGHVSICLSIEHFRWPPVSLNYVDYSFIVYLYPYDQRLQTACCPSRWSITNWITSGDMHASHKLSSPNPRHLATQASPQVTQPKISDLVELVKDTYSRNVIWPTIILPHVISPTIILPPLLDHNLGYKYPLYPISDPSFLLTYYLVLFVLFSSSMKCIDFVWALP